MPPGEWLPVSDAAWRVLRLACSWIITTDGAFDPTFRSQGECLPAPRNRLDFDESRRAVRRTHPGVRVGLGAIGKGFAGAMKRHNFGGLRASHGVSISHRSPLITAMMSPAAASWRSTRSRPLKPQILVTRLASVVPESTTLALRSAALIRPSPAIWALLWVMIRAGAAVSTVALRLTVAVLPEAEEVDVLIDPQELEITVARASGPGGQGVAHRPA